MLRRFGAIYILSFGESDGPGDIRTLFLHILRTRVYKVTASYVTFRVKIRLKVNTDI
jgi:hypothetical protein